MARKSDGAEKSEKKRGRPRVASDFKPTTARRRKVADFGTRTGADEWMRGRLAKQAEDYEFIIDQLQLDLKANTKAMKSGSSTELMRARQSIMTSMRTMMAGQQMLMISLMKEKKLLGNLGEEDGGGDTIINVTKLPARPDAPDRGDLPEDG